MCFLRCVACSSTRRQGPQAPSEYIREALEMWDRKRQYIQERSRASQTVHTSKNQNGLHLSSSFQISQTSEGNSPHLGDARRPFCARSLGTGRARRRGRDRQGRTQRGRVLTKPTRFRLDGQPRRGAASLSQQQINRHFQSLTATNNLELQLLFWGPVGQVMNRRGMTEQAKAELRLPGGGA